MEPTREELESLLRELYRNVVEDIPPEIGSRHLWDTMQEVAYALNIQGSRTNF